MDTGGKLTEDNKDGLMDEAEKLIWAHLDELIEEDDVKRLEELLDEHEQVRQRYLSCAQIHADLYRHYGTSPQLQVQSPVLGSLGTLPPMSSTMHR